MSRIWQGPTISRIPARAVRPGDSILVDPLDRRTVADVADVERSSHVHWVDLVAIYEGDIISIRMDRDRIVSRIRHDSESRTLDTCQV